MRQATPTTEPIETAPRSHLTVKATKVRAGQYTYRNLTITRHDVLGRRWYIQTDDQLAAYGSDFIAATTTLDGALRFIGKGHADYYLPSPCSPIVVPPRRRRSTATTLQRSADSTARRWCWQATLLTLGLPEPARWPSGKHPCRFELLAAIYHGYTRSGNLLGDDWRNAKRMTLARFIAEHPTGTFFIGTAGHAMVLVDGVLTDTARHQTGRRIVQAAYELTARPTIERVAA